MKHFLYDTFTLSADTTQYLNIGDVQRINNSNELNLK